jgi:ornithine cyclodeaminase/alanine dehydrogenase-like protein (mu-crystallin family)
MRILSRQEIETLISMRDAIALMEEVFAALARGEALVPERTALSLPGTDNSIVFMPGYLVKSGSIGLKTVSVFPTNAARGIPTISAQILLCDSETGETKALLEGGYLTALRTAATTAVATKHLARETAESLGVFGAGVQAKSQIESHFEVRLLKRVLIYDPNKQRAAALVKHVQSTRGSACECTAAGSPGEVLASSDIIVTATTSPVPVFDGRSVKEGTHINAIGSFKPVVREVDDAIVRRSRIFVDSYEHALKEAGDLIIPMKSGIINRGDIKAELGELIVGTKKGRERTDEITLFKSVGMAVQDIAVAEVVYQKAREHNLGLVV